MTIQYEVFTIMTDLIEHYKIFNRDGLYTIEFINNVIESRQLEIIEKADELNQLLLWKKELEHTSYKVICLVMNAWKMVNGQRFHQVECRIMKVPKIDGEYNYKQSNQHIRTIRLDTATDYSMIDIVTQIEIEKRIKLAYTDKIDKFIFAEH